MTMQKYDYFSAVCADVRDFIKENINAADFSDREELEEHLNDALWTEDSNIYVELNIKPLMFIQ